MDLLTTQAIPSLKGSSFKGAVQTAGGGATFAQVQLWNPAASGKLLIVRGLIVFIGAAAQVIIGGHNTELANPGAPATASNKFAGGAVSTALLRTATPAGVLVPTNLTDQFQLPAATPLLVPLARPIVVPANYGLAVGASIVNILAGAVFDFDEVPG